MQLNEQLIQAIIDSFTKEKETIALGTNKASEMFLKKLALTAELEHKKFKVIPSCFHLASIASSLGLKIAKPTEEIDLAIEFASKADYDFNFIKNETHSLIRDKIAARMSEELLIIIEKENLIKRLTGRIPFEISKFAFNLTLAELECFGNAKLRMQKDKPFLTETNHYIVDVEIDKIHSLNDIEIQSKSIPGVLETGLFLNYADKMILVDNNKIELKTKTKEKGIKALK